MHLQLKQPSERNAQRESIKSITIIFRRDKMDE